MTSSRSMFNAVILTACGLVAGCAAQPNHASPAVPTQAPTIGSFIGDWTRAYNLSVTINGTPSGCSKFDYTIGWFDSNSADVTFDLTCLGYDIKGTGTGVFESPKLTWSAGGTLTRGATSCAFTLTDNTATVYSQANDQIVISYNMTVCGVAFSGADLMKRKGS